MAERKSEWRGGWTTVLGAALGYGAGPILLGLTSSVFVRPVMEDTGWSTAEVLVQPIFGFLTAILSPVTGRLADRYGARRVIVVGLVAHAVAVSLFAVLPTTKLTYYGIAVAIGLVGSLAATVSFSRAVAAWFDASAGKAFGLMGVGMTVMPVLAIPLISLAVYGISWRAGYLVLAGFALVIALPAVVFLIKSPDGESAAAPRFRTEDVEDGAGTTRERSRGAVVAAARSPRFWVLVVAITLVFGCITGFLGQLQPLLLDSGLSVAVATTITSLWGIGALVGRLFAGVLLDMANRYFVVVVVTLLSAVGAIAAANVIHLPVALSMIGVLMVALCQGAEGDIAAYFVLKEYGSASFGAIYGVVFGFSGIGILGVPYAFGAIRDATGSYSAVGYASAALLLASALLMVLHGITRERRSPEPAPEVVRPTAA